MNLRLANVLAAAGRSLARRPRFSAGAIGLLGSTLLAVILIAVLLDAVALRPLPFAKPDELVAVRATVQRETLERRAFSRLDFADYAAQAADVVALAGYDTTTSTLRGAGPPRVLPGEIVDPAYFEVLAVSAQLGRALAPGDASAPVAVISDTLWRGAFAAAPDVLGRGISIDTRPYTIVGVMPAGFGGVNGLTDVWVPFDSPGAMDPGDAEDRHSRWHEAIGRLAPGATLRTANERLAAIGLRLAEADPGNAGRSADALPLREELLGQERAAVGAATVGVALLVLISVLNLGGLAVVAATRRELEHAMRLYLGASPLRLFAAAAGEGAIVGVAATAVAALVAWLLLPHLAAVLPIDLPAFVRLGLRAETAFATLAIGVACGVIAFSFGAAVARRARPDSLRSGVRATRQHGAMRKILVGGEIALGIALLAAALMLARSFASIAALDPGYRVEQTVVMDVELPADRYDPAAAALFGQRLLGLAREQPGVIAAAVSSDSPLSNGASAHYATSDRMEREPTRVYGHGVSPGFFATAGMRVLHGDEFPASADAAGEPVAIVSAKLARRMWGSEDVVGRRIMRGGLDAGAPWLRIVGVVEDVRWRGMPDGPTADPDMFVPLSQAPQLAFSLLLHTSDEPHATAKRVGEKLRSLDADVPVQAVETIARRLHTATQIPRFLAGLGVLFSAVALLLSALGIYAIAALDGSQRERELAIRQAVGASGGALRRLFIGEYGRIFALATLVGLVGMVPLARVLESRLYGISSVDPLSLIGAVGLFLLALGAGMIGPLRRVSAVEPGLLMRGE